MKMKGINDPEEELFRSDWMPLARRPDVVFI